MAFLLGLNRGWGGSRNECNVMLGDVLEFEGWQLGHCAMGPAGIEADLV